MGIFKKYNTYPKRFVLFLTFTALFSCGSHKVHNDRIEGKKIGITSQYSNNPEIENFIAPYRTHIDKDLDSVLSYCPETMDKSKGSRWQTTIGNLLAETTFNAADKLFYTRENKHVDICLLNHGGIRAIIPKGDVTARTAYNVMPFENSLVIVGLKGEQIKEMAEYMIREGKPHPLDGMTIVIDSNNTIKSVLVQNKPLDLSKTYYVATSDYLYNGGDSMFFFQKALSYFEADYKLRNILIDYFKTTDTLPVITTERIIIQ